MIGGSTLLKTYNLMIRDLAAGFSLPSYPGLNSIYTPPQKYAYTSVYQNITLKIAGGMINMDLFPKRNEMHVNLSSPFSSDRTPSKPADVGKIVYFKGYIYIMSWYMVVQNSCYP